MMHRRSLLKTGAAAALGASSLSGLAQQQVTLKFHTFMAPLSNVWINMHKAWMSKVEKDSGGRIKFEAYPAMQLGGTPVQLYDQTRDGVRRETDIGINESKQRMARKVGENVTGVLLAAPAGG